MRDNDNDLVVVKANRMIQNYKYTLTKQELRIVNFIISNINSPKYDETLNSMEFQISEFYKLLGMEHAGGKDYLRLQAILQGLSNKSSDYIDFGEYETIVRWIDKPKFNKNSGTVTLKLDDDLKPFLLQATGVVSAKLKYYFEMDSKYSMRLYELLRSWDGYSEKKFEVDELKILIDARNSSYKNFAKFRQAVLDIAVDEINLVTDLSVSYEPITRGRKVIEVKFYIAKKQLDGVIVDKNQMTIDDILVADEVKQPKQKNKKTAPKKPSIADDPELYQMYGEYYEALQTLNDTWPDEDFDVPFIEMLLSDCRAVLSDELFYLMPAEQRHLITQYIYKQAKYAIYYNSKKKKIEDLKAFMRGSCKKDWGGFKQQ